MRKLSDFICRHHLAIAILSVLLLIPALGGYLATKINYDLLVYLPSDIETLAGQEILTDEFGMGAFSIGVVNQMPQKGLLNLEEKIRGVDGVKQVLSLADLRTFAELDELYAKTNRLANSSQQLVDGTAKLNQGVSELKEAVVLAKTKLQKQQSALDQATLNSIKSSARTAAAQNIQAQSSAIQQQIMTKLSADPSLTQLLMPAAQQMCQANPATASLCDEPTVLQTYLDGIMTQLGATLSESSLELAQNVASQTASSVAESVATKVASSVQDGITSAVVNALDEMLAGIEKLQNGSTELQSGMMRFDNEGIKPLANFVNGKVRVTTDKVERLIKLAEQYDNYAGIADGAKGTTKFVLMIEEKR